jgi:FAD/FMN-containing dehydrogenase
MMKDPQVTIIVVPRERFSHTRRSLENIYDQTNVPFNLVYVDGGSPTYVRRYLEGEAQRRKFQLIRTNHYLSPNEARNLGLRQPKTKYTVFIDNDALVTPGWLSVLVESDLPTGAAAEELASAVAACEEAGATSTVQAADPQEADWLRQARRLAFRALERQGTVRMEDIGVPRSRVPELLRAIEAVAMAHGIRCATFGHAGDGNLHPNFIFDRDDPRAEELTEAARADLYRAALALGGTVTAEHGIGAARREFLAAQVGQGTLDVMRSIKAALDPLGILNPGRVV